MPEWSADDYDAVELNSICAGALLKRGSAARLSLLRYRRLPHPQLLGKIQHDLQLRHGVKPARHRNTTFTGVRGISFIFE